MLLTNDRDFFEHSGRVSHAGIVVYSSPELSPGAFVRGIDRLNRFFTPDSMKNNVERLEDWL